MSDHTDDKHDGLIASIHSFAEEYGLNNLDWIEEFIEVLKLTPTNCDWNSLSDKVVAGISNLALSAAEAFGSYDLGDSGIGRSFSREAAGAAEEFLKELCLRLPAEAMPRLLELYWSLLTASYVERTNSVDAAVQWLLDLDRNLVLPRVFETVGRRSDIDLDEPLDPDAQHGPETFNAAALLVLIAELDGTVPADDLHTAALIIAENCFFQSDLSENCVCLHASESLIKRIRPKPLGVLCRMLRTVVAEQHNGFQRGELGRNDWSWIVDEIEIAIQRSVPIEAIADIPADQTEHAGREDAVRVLADVLRQCPENANVVALAEACRPILDRGHTNQLAPPASVAKWLASRWVLDGSETLRHVSRKLLDQLTQSCSGEEQSATAAVRSSGSGGEAAAARWLLSRSLRGQARGEAVDARNLLRAMADSDDVAEREAARKVLGGGDVVAGIRWLAVQALTQPEASVVSRTVRRILERMLKAGRGQGREGDQGNKEQEAAYSAASKAVIWMVRHSLPASVAVRKAKQLIESPNASALQWATQLFDGMVRNRLEKYDWKFRCTFADRFGVDFKDEAVHFAWTRVGKYVESESDPIAWLNLILINYWRDLKRKWWRLFERKPHRAIEELLDILSDTEIASSAERPKLKLPDNLSPSDIAKLKRWEAIDGLLAGCEAGLSDIIPFELWENWLAKLKLDPARVRKCLDSKEPFDRRELLTHITGFKRNTLDQRWRRLRRKLAGLDCMSQLLTDFISPSF